MKALVIGASGMAGHVIALHLHERGWEVQGVCRSLQPSLPFPCHSLDLEAKGALDRLQGMGSFDVVINCAGVLNQAAADSPASAVWINAYLPHWLVETYRKGPTRVIHLSTDCVFSGRTGAYADDAFRDGDTFYDRSKALGEFSSPKDLVFRQSIIGPDLRPEGIGLLNWFLRQKGHINGYTNAHWNGVTTLELAKAIEAAIREGLSGLYQFVPQETIVKHDLLILFAREFQTGTTIHPVSLPVTIDKTLVSIRSDFGHRAPGYPAQLADLHQWMRQHHTLYPHYPLGVDRSSL